MKHLLYIIFLILPFWSQAQLGVSAHQSVSPLIGVHYEIADRIRPEIRVGTNTSFRHLFTEGMVTYDILATEYYEGYAGIGFLGIDQFNDYSPEYLLLIPVGLNIYPLKDNNFGFQIEVSPMLSEESFLIGSWGIRYRFN